MLFPACAQSIPSEADGRAQFEAKREQWIKSGELVVVDFRKVDGKMMEIMGTKLYQLRYEATLEYPKGQTCSMIALAAGCEKRAAGERATVEGDISFEKTEKGWNPVRY